MAWMIKAGCKAEYMAGNGAGQGADAPALLIESGKQTAACGWRLVATPRHVAHDDPAAAVTKQVWQDVLVLLTA